MVAILVVVAVAGCADASNRIDTAVPQALDDRVIDVFTTSACGDIRVEVDEDDDEVTLRAYDDTPGELAHLPKAWSIWLRRSLVEGSSMGLVTLLSMLPERAASR